MDTYHHLSHALTSSYHWRRNFLRTQAFSNASGPVSTPASHSIEASTWAALQASRLGLDPGFVFLISIAHDIGKNPVGHLGERVLNAWTGGRFTHAENGVRALEEIEVETGLDFGAAVKHAVRIHSMALDSDAFLTIPAAMQLMIISDKVSHLAADTVDALAAGLIQLSEIPADVVATLGPMPSQWPRRIGDNLVESSSAGLVRLAQPTRDALVAHKVWLCAHVYRPFGAGGMESAHLEAVLKHLSYLGDRSGRDEDRLAAALDFADLTDDDILALVDLLAPDYVDICGGWDPVHIGEKVEAYAQGS